MKSLSSIPTAGPKPPKPPKAAAPAGREPRPPRLRGNRVYSTGPKHLGLHRAPERLGGPGQPPEGFVGAHTSYPEWIVFYWLWVVMVGDVNAHGGVRNPDNWSGPPSFEFSYQKFLPGGGISGQTNVDFLINQPYNGAFLVRLMGERHHLFTKNEQIVRDWEQAGRLTGANRVVVNIWEQHLLTETDRWNGAAHRVCRDASQGVEWRNPINAGTARATRPSP